MPMIASLLCGLIFGAGLLISGMVQPIKVLGFLDIFGAWDPSLAVVMIAALAVSVPGFVLVNGGSRPLLATGSFFWPTKRDIDLPLIVGAALFGIGWGLVGSCVRGRPWNASRRSRQACSCLSQPWPAASRCMTSGRNRAQRRDMTVPWRLRPTGETGIAGRPNNRRAPHPQRRPFWLRGGCGCPLDPVGIMD